MLFFILDYLLEKLTWQNFSKNPKNPILGLFWALFAQILTKMNFPEKKGLCQYLSTIVPKIQENTNESFLRKILNCWTNRQQWLYRTLLGTGFQLLKQLLAFLNLYQHTNNQLISLISSWNTANFRVLRSEWHKHLWPCPPQYFSINL